MYLASNLDLENYIDSYADVVINGIPTKVFVERYDSANRNELFLLNSNLKVLSASELQSCICIAPFNLLSFLTVPNGCYPLSSLFDIEVISPSYVSACNITWRIKTDDCGYNITYYSGTVDNLGRLVSGSNAAATGFNSATLNFCSTYLYAEGIYVQLGVNGQYPDTLPCIAGGNQTP